MEIMYVIENTKTGERVSLPNEDDQILWDKVERMEAMGMKNLIVRVCTRKEEKNNEGRMD